MDVAPRAVVPTAVEVGEPKRLMLVVFVRNRHGAE
jgi:hypothetical protein